MFASGKTMNDADFSHSARPSETTDRDGIQKEQMMQLWGSKGVCNRRIQDHVEKRKPFSHIVRGEENCDH
jgi:hypothetical protein